MAATAKKIKPAPSMKFSIERSVLLKALGRLQGIVERRNTIPILSNIKLDAEKDSVQLTVTDMDIAASESIEASVDTGGALTIPAHTFYDIIRKLPEGSQVELHSNEASSQLIVLSGSARFALSYLPAKDFPVMPEGDLTHSFSLSANQFAALVEKARFAMSIEETRYYLNGIYLHVAKDEKNNAVLRAVATDGHRLARIQIAVPEGAEGMPGVIVPRKTVGEIKKLVEDEENGDIAVALSENKIRFQIGGRVLLSKLIDGTFPDYDRVIPKNNDKIMEVNARLFSAAVDRVSTISLEKTKGIKLALTKGRLSLSAQSPESGTASEEMEVSYDAGSLEIGFNSRYMLEMMTQIAGESVQFLFSDPAAPVLARDPADINALYVIMPMRV